MNETIITKEQHGDLVKELFFALIDSDIEVSDASLIEILVDELGFGGGWTNNTTDAKVTVNGDTARLDFGPGEYIEFTSNDRVLEDYDINGVLHDIKIEDISNEYDLFDYEEEGLGVSRIPDLNLGTYYISDYNGARISAKALYENENGIAIWEDTIEKLTDDEIDLSLEYVADTSKGRLMVIIPVHNTWTNEE